MIMRRAFKHWWQRLTRGFDDSETWNLDITISRYTLPRLKRYKEIANEIIDWSFYDKEEGCNILGELIWYHELIVAGKEFPEDKEGVDRYERASKLWGKYYLALWW